MKLNNIIPNMKKWHITVKVIPILVFIYILKFLFHKYWLEVVSINALFTSLIAGTIFLIWFLLNGVISDYKESEKLPGEIAACLETIYDEYYILDKNKWCKVTKDFIVFYKDFIKSVNDWFYRKEKTSSILKKLHTMNNHFAEFESIIQPNFLSRMKTEQNNLRKMIIRIDNIRDLSFIPSAYAILEILVFLVIGGLLILKIEPNNEATFFTMIVSFLFIYMIFLIKDLDNPFDYKDHWENGSEVSIKPIHDVIKRISEEK